MANCRFCHYRLHDVVIDLGSSPLSNAYIPPERSMAMEPHYPLKVWFCPQCGLVQLEAFTSPDDIFSEYDYFSSYSDTWLEHAARYVDHMICDYGVNSNSQVVEIASNDGYLLQYFLQRGIPSLGVEPAANVAQVARERGVPTKNAFFGADTARALKARGYAADLMLGNNVLAHVPDINDFVEGFHILLKPDGFMTVEFPHLLHLIREVQFDTIYHEHFSYLSLGTVRTIFAAHGLEVFHVEELPTHGGSLRVFACQAACPRTVSAAVQDVLNRERAAGLWDGSGYHTFARAALDAKLDLLDFLIGACRSGKKVCGYGAAAKGNTLLNYAGVRQDLIAAVADRSPHKQGKLLPGSRIPVVSPEAMLELRPDYVLVLPWNLKEEIMRQLEGIRAWGGRFVTAVPQLKVWP